MKGIMSVVELVIVAIVLFVAFETLFSGATYTNRWNEAELVLKSRDILTALDRSGNFYQKIFSTGDISNFVYSVLPERDLLISAAIDGAVKNKIVVACNCTDTQISNLVTWIGNTKINGRTVAFDFVPTDLSDIPESDVLLVFGYKPLSAYKQNMKDYLDKGNGIVEIMDFTSNVVDSDPTQTEIFGLKWVETATDTFDTAKFSHKPVDSKDNIYFPYKYFYHAPSRLIGEVSTPIGGCTADPIFSGKLAIKQKNYNFWICSPTTVWFDTNADGNMDALAAVGNNVTFDGSVLYLNYIDSNTIGLSFKPDYTFQDFLGLPNGQIFHVEPGDNNVNRVVIYSESVSPSKKFPAVIVNNTAGRVAWISDFTDSGVGDDERLLLSSLLFWSSDKTMHSITGNLKFGYSTSYLNVNNTDVYEVYRFDLGLGHPF